MEAYIDENGFWNVEASWICSTQFVFKCPNCKELHRHGSNGDFRHRVESRVGHCQKNPSSFQIHITENTAIEPEQKKRRKRKV